MPQLVCEQSGQDLVRQIRVDGDARKPVRPGIDDKGQSAGRVVDVDTSGNDVDDQNVRIELGHNGAQRSRMVLRITERGCECRMEDADARQCRIASRVKRHDEKKRDRQTHSEMEGA